MSFWLLFKPSKPGITTSKAANTRFLFSPTAITFDNLWIQRVWAFARSAGLKSFLATIFGSIIVKKKQTELQMLYLVFFSEMIKKKPIFELKTLKSFIVCSPHWQTHQFQVLAQCFWPSRPSIRFSSVKSMLCYSSGVSGVPSKPSLPTNNLIKPILVVWGSGYQSCRRPTTRPKNWGNKKPTVIKKSMRFFTIRAYRLYPKPFKGSWLAITITIFWPAILASRRLANCWPKNTTSQPSTTTSRPTWKTVTFVWSQK